MGEMEPRARCLCLESWMKGVWGWVYESVWSPWVKGFRAWVCKYWESWVKWVRARCLCLDHG